MNIQKTFNATLAELHTELRTAELRTEYFVHAVDTFRRMADSFLPPILLEHACPAIDPTFFASVDLSPEPKPSSTEWESESISESELELEPEPIPAEITYTLHFPFASYEALARSDRTELSADGKRLNITLQYTKVIASAITPTGALLTTLAITLSAALPKEDYELLCDLGKVCFNSLSYTASAC